MIVVTMLMYTVSLKLQLLPCVTIHNQCSNIKLISPVYFGNDAVCPKLSDQPIDISTRMKVCFEINAAQNDFEGALLYKLQRYVEFDGEFNMDTSTIETNKNQAMHIYMLSAWKVKDSRLFVYVTFVEHTKEFIWNEEKLKKLYDKNFGWFKEYKRTASNTWLIDDNMALKTTFKAREFEKNFELSISISEEERNDYAMRPFCINLER
jgi:hypothetical protein